jgi:hypothetical protein
MSIETVSAPAPDSIEAKALAELEKDGHVIGTEKPDVNDGEIKDTPAPPKETPKADAPKVDAPQKDAPVDEEKKPDRAPTMVEAWKLRTAEDQKDKLAKQVSELSIKLDELSKQKAPVTVNQAEDIKEEIAKLAKDKDVDVEFLTGFADSILRKAESKYKPSADIEKTVKQLQSERQLEKELNEYSNEFDKDVTPLLEEYQLSGEALSRLKKSLRDYAFSETYAKVPLKEIFAIKKSEFSLQVPKKSSEGKGVKARANDVVDIENISEDDFSKLPPEKIEEFMSKRTSGTWKRR